MAAQFQEHGLQQALFDELSDIRLRGVIRIDREDSKTRPLYLPAFDLLVAASPWKEEIRSLAITHLLERSLEEVTYSRYRVALQALFGLGEYAGAFADERTETGLTVLGVKQPVSASKEKEAIGDARHLFAQAIVRSAASGFRRRMMYLPPSDEQLSPEAEAVHEELVALRDRNNWGVTPEAIEAQAPRIVALSGTQSELRLSRRLASDAETTTAGRAAIAYMTCVSLQSDMHSERLGRLVNLSLGLTSNQQPAASRVERWMEGEGIDDPAVFADKQARAYWRFAGELVKHFESPCRDRPTTIFEENSALGDAVLTMLSSYDIERQRDISERVLYSVVALLPGARAYLESVAPHARTATEQFDALLGAIQVELGEWERQYRERIDANAPFLRTDLRATLLAASTGGKPFELTPEGVEFNTVYAHLEDPEFRAQYGMPAFGDIERQWDRAVAVTRISIGWTLRLLAQLLDYNERTGYWGMFGAIPDLRDAEYMPNFPIEPIAEFSDVRAR